MKRYNHLSTHWQAFFLSCLLIFSGAACTQDEALVKGKDAEGGVSAKEARVGFSILTPSPPETRATPNPVDEGAVTGVFILLFEHTASGKVYRHRISAESLSTISPTEKKFYARLPKGTYDLVVLANATDILASSNLVAGTLKEEALSSLVDTHPGAWDKATIPMWGQVDNQLIDEATDFTGANAILMIRMLAKVELVVSEKAAGTNQTNFLFTDIRLYNYSSQGRLTPNPSFWSEDQKATQPSPPASGYGTKSYPHDEPARFESRIFYTYEAPAGGGGQALATNTCMVIGGRYRGGDLSYYRVDFIHPGPPLTYLPLLRNHCYQVTITEVLGEGFPTPEMAFENVSAPMLTGVVQWSEGGMKEVTADDQGLLEVSSGSFRLPNYALNWDSPTNKLTIRTSVPGGWTIEKITDQNSTVDAAAPWLTISELSDSGTAPKDVYLYTENNTTGAERRAWVYIRAGRLSFRVSVSQQELSLLSIHDINAVEVSELFYNGTTEVHHNFVVEWGPSSATVSIRPTDIGKDPDGNPAGFYGDGHPNTDITGVGYEDFETTGYAITGEDMTIYATKLDFVLVNAPEILTRSLILTQYKPATAFVFPSEYFPTGQEQTFGVRSNISWEITQVKDPHQILANAGNLVGKTGGGNISWEGEKVSFRFAEKFAKTDVEYFDAEVTLRNSEGKTLTGIIRLRLIFPVNNLWVWSVDLPRDQRSWYDLANVPDGTNSMETPPNGPQSTPVNPLSCAAIDPSNPTAWRLPTRDELSMIYNNFNASKGYAYYNMCNVNTTLMELVNPTNQIDLYWASDADDVTPDPANAFITTKIQGSAGVSAHSLPTVKTAQGTSPHAPLLWHIHARCVRNK
ncbi:MAG: FimB/Mfa2 family fimbrial subunit [Tannerellaceae bacterium]|jgi:hypothetical protein|nr:FimB/Mfa2 family fimbrial subunit [Tannerellaceae bacterium]